MAIKKRETNKSYEPREIRDNVTVTYERASEDKGVMFVGLNKKGNLYLSMGADDNHEFVNGYEALSIINQLLYQFDSVDVEYHLNKTKEGTEYETATVTDYHI